MKQYMNNPDAYLVNQRLVQLETYYGKLSLQDEVLWASNNDKMLKVHVNNLILTFGTALVLELADIIFYGKVG